jgi:hypothetical protein
MLRNFVLNLEKRIQYNHHPNIPREFAMLISAKRGSGKTCLLLQMLLEPEFLDYENIMIYTTTPFQQEYQLLYHGFTNGLSKEAIAAIALHQDDFKGVPIPLLCKQYAVNSLSKEKTNITITLSNKFNEIPDPDELDKSKKNLIIFDDCMEQNQTTISSYYTRGRHGSCNCIYLSNYYFEVPVVVRQNTNFLILFKHPQRNTINIYNSVGCSSMEKNKFLSYVNTTWSKKYSYVVIDMDKDRVYNDLFTENMDPSDDEE